MAYKAIPSEYEGGYPTYELTTWMRNKQDGGWISVQHSHELQNPPYIRLGYEDAFNGFWVEMPPDSAWDLIRALMQCMAVASTGRHAEVYAKLKEAEEAAKGGA